MKRTGAGAGAGTGTGTGTPTPDPRLRTPDLSSFLEAAYARFHTLEHVEHDPLRFPRRYPDPADAEVAALIAAVFAFGRVASILGTLERVFARLGPHPAATLAGMDGAGAEAAAAGIVHRFVGPAQTAGLFCGIGAVLRRDGGLKPAFLRGYGAGGDAMQGLAALAADLRTAAGEPGPGFLLPVEGAAGPAKRLNLFLRWVVRRDGIDLGLWPEIPPAALLVPMDVHVSRIARFLGLLPPRSSGPTLRDARGLTEALRAFDAADPVRFDFALSHLGISGTCRGGRDPEACPPCVLAGACRAPARK